MANHSQALPQEVWNNIFDQVENPKQLAQCRLVCKQWNPIAEKAMFGKDFAIPDDANFIPKLYYHLARKPTLALSIKKLFLPASATASENLVFVNLLNLAMTSSLEQLKTLFHSEERNNLIYQIILSSPCKFNRIKRLPPLDTKSDLYPEHLCAFKNSLESMQLSINGKEPNMARDQLNEFTKLDCLELDYANIQDIMELDLTLRQLQCATKLRLWLDFTEEDFVSKGNDQMRAWLAQNVEKDERVKSVIDMSKEYRCELIGYLVYKYPNLHHLELHDMTIDLNIGRVLEATQHVPFLKLVEWECDGANYLWTVGHMMKSSSNIVRIAYEPDYESDESACQIEEVCRDDSIKTSKFSILLPAAAPHTYIKQLLSSFGSGTSEIITLNVDIDNSNDQDNPQDLMTLYDILRLAPNVQDFEFGDHTIEYQELGTVDLTLNGLKALKFMGAEIDHRVITQLDSIAPNLGRLTMQGCLVTGKEGKFVITMPHSNLSLLKFEFDAFDELEELGLDDQIVYISIKTEPNPKTYYLWKPESQVVTMMSKEEFDLQATSSISVQIECESLSSLSLKLKGMKTTLQFEHGVVKSFSLKQSSLY